MPSPLVTLKLEDFPGLDKASGGEADKLFRALNLTTTEVQTTLGGGFTLTGNGRAFKKSVDFRSSGLPLKFKSTIPSVMAVVIAQALDVTVEQNPVPVSMPNPAWTTSGDQVVVSDLGTLNAAKAYRVTFLVLG